MAPMPLRAAAQPLPTSPYPQTETDLPPNMTSVVRLRPSRIDSRQEYRLSNFCFVTLKKLKKIFKKKNLPVIDIHRRNAELSSFWKLIQSVNASDAFFHNSDDLFENCRMVLEHEMRRISSIVKDQIWVPAGARRESNIILAFKLKNRTLQRIFQCTTKSPARLLLSTRKLEFRFQPKQRRLRFALKKCYRRTNGLLLRAWQVFLSERQPEKHILKIFLQNSFSIRN